MLFRLTVRHWIRRKRSFGELLKKEVIEMREHPFFLLDSDPQQVTVRRIPVKQLGLRTTGGKFTVHVKVIK